MKVCGFTIVRNAVKYDYPVVESIKSILPLCDKVIVAVGNSSDETRNLILSINDPKIEILDTIWDDTLRTGGAVLAVETNKAFDAIAQDYDWGFYIQADEVLHEQYYDEIRQSMQTYLNDEKVEGLLLKYVHFYGNYKYVGNTRQWYRREIRIVRNRKQIRSFRDAQGFRIDGRKLNVKLIDACIYHYGWVKNPLFLKAKEKDFHRMWHPDEWIKERVKDELLFDLNTIDSLGLFEGTHPEVMKERIARLDWDFEFDIRKSKLGAKKYILHLFEKYTGHRLFEYRNYKII